MGGINGTPSAFILSQAEVFRAPWAPSQLMFDAEAEPGLEERIISPEVMYGGR
jgi:hypothetical protein